MPETERICSFCQTRIGDGGLVIDHLDAVCWVCRITACEARISDLEGEMKAGIESLQRIDSRVKTTLEEFRQLFQVRGRRAPGAKGGTFN